MKSYTSHTVERMRQKERDKEMSTKAKKGTIKSLWIVLYKKNSMSKVTDDGPVNIPFG